MRKKLKLLFIIVNILLIFVSCVKDNIPMQDQANLVEANNLSSLKEHPSGKYYIWGGDILLDKSDENHQFLINEIIEQNAETKGVRSWKTILWADNKILYCFQSTFSKNEKDIIKNAMVTWENASGIDFKEGCFSEANYKSHVLNIYKVKGNISRATLGSADRPIVELGTFSRDIVIHELGHVIGLSHEHQRPDRNNYITVHKENLGDDGDWDSDFKKLRKSKEVCDLWIFFCNTYKTKTYGKYDYLSIMHYSKRLFGKPGKDMITVNRDTPKRLCENRMGFVNFLSTIDQYTARKLYGIPNKPDIEILDKYDSDINNCNKDIPVLGKYIIPPAFGYQNPSTTTNYRIYNRGKKELHIHNVEVVWQSGSDFSIISKPTKPIKYNEYGIVKIQYNPTVVGSSSATIRVHSNDPDTDEAEIDFTVRGNAIMSKDIQRVSFLAKATKSGSNVYLTENWKSRSAKSYRVVGDSINLIKKNIDKILKIKGQITKYGSFNGLIIVDSISKIYVETTPLYRLLHPVKKGDHFYTASYREKLQVTGRGYRDEGIACYLLPQYISGSTIFYRLYNSKINDHFYTTSHTEMLNASRHLGYKYEGAVGYIYRKQVAGTIPLYRAYNASAGNHFYTTNHAEMLNANYHLGYKYEGIAGYVYSSQKLVDTQY